ncbi:hypothetical protein BCR43DRAFT_489864 [Syncephalastrum racemosum]|uniref:RRM domain-containing protein n=1 Tax=Syncephalastrum racemosum TaxID=13706 RepID=A0A1X2HF13_SYNRA|nr:hypothetical protein BCR43DRAFT_489864 [Syncephalastrum racemosum]
MSRRNADRMAIDDEPPVRRGRGFQEDTRSRRNDDVMEEDASEGGLTPMRSIEGWIIIVRGVHPETDEETLNERFSEFGTVKNIHLNLDRRTGFVKGYALIEYETLKEAQTAIDEANDTELFDQRLKVSYAFIKPSEEDAVRGNGDRRSSHRSRRDRSLSPGR